MRNLKKPLYPISFCTDRSGFPPAREWRFGYFWRFGHSRQGGFSRCCI